ncbi:hypothetical protein B5K03_21515 [Rhizobium phaseoli]|nr:hypothetical protein B5K03_21515 [Rhizobium phaseoli]
MKWQGDVTLSSVQNIGLDVWSLQNGKLLVAQRNHTDREALRYWRGAPTPVRRLGRCLEKINMANTTTVGFTIGSAIGCADDQLLSIVSHSMRRTEC